MFKYSKLGFIRVEKKRGMGGKKSNIGEQRTLGEHVFCSNLGASKLLLKMEVGVAGERGTCSRDRLTDYGDV